jgi:hypothetical protein
MKRTRHELDLSHWIAQEREKVDAARRAEILRRAVFTADVLGISAGLVALALLRWFCGA